MEQYVAAVEETISFFQRELPWSPDVCLMLGTGLGGVARAMDVAWKAGYDNIPNFPVSTSPDHAGKLLVGKIGNAKVALFQGRFHFYEGYSTRELTFPIRVMAGLGAKVLIGCNAAGGLNLDFSSGDLMLITDHINLIPDNPLRGSNMETWGLRFPDLSKAYSITLREKIIQVAENMGMALRKGIFVAVSGGDCCCSCRDGGIGDLGYWQCKRSGQFPAHLYRGRYSSGPEGGAPSRTSSGNLSEGAL
jgi:purine-nucleoside phosphorylase